MPKDTKASALLKRRMFWSLCFTQIVFKQLDLREWGTSGEGTQVHVWREQNAAPQFDMRTLTNVKPMKVHGSGRGSPRLSPRVHEQGHAIAVPQHGLAVRAR